MFQAKFHYLDIKRCHDNACRFRINTNTQKLNPINTCLARWLYIWSKHSSRRLWGVPELLTPVFSSTGISIASSRTITKYLPWAEILLSTVRFLRFFPTKKRFDKIFNLVGDSYDVAPLLVCSPFVAPGSGCDLALVSTIPRAVNNSVRKGWANFTSSASGAGKNTSGFDSLLFVVSFSRRFFFLSLLIIYQRFIFVKL